MGKPDARVTTSISALFQRWAVAAGLASKSAACGLFFWRLVEELKVVALRGGFEKHAYLRLIVSMLKHGPTLLNSY